MHELDQLRGWDAGAAPLTDEARNRGRIRLFAAMNGSAPVKPVRGLRPGLALAGVLVVAVTATLLVGPGDERPAEDLDHVSAGTVLHGAAAQEREHGPRLAPRRDQFIYTKTVVIYTAKDQTRHVEEFWRPVDPRNKLGWGYSDGVGPWTSAQSAIPGDSPSEDWADLKKLPTGPDSLLATMRNQHSFGAEQTLKKAEWGSIYSDLTSLLRQVPVMPEGLRPAVYEAMSRIPGVKATRGVKDLRGRAGVAVFFPGAKEVWDEFPVPKGTFLFDEKTHDYLGDCDEWEGRRCVAGSYLDAYAVTDKAKQRPRS